MCCSVLQCVAVCCSVLQCVAVCCSVLQCVAAVCCSSVLQQCVAAVCCSVLQCVAVCCSVLKCNISCRNCFLNFRSGLLVALNEEIGVVLQCVATRCSVLQCVAVCCSALQCVAAVRCSLVVPLNEEIYDWDQRAVEISGNRNNSIHDLLLLWCHGYDCVTGRM